MAFTLSSSDFSNGADVPRQFTCEGADQSPALAWGTPPEKTQSLAVIVDDPDAPAGVWTHWVYYDLPPSLTSLPQNVAKIEEPPTGGRQGRNAFHKLGYNGPCPPPGKPHRYFFKLFAVDTKLNLKPGASKGDVEKAIEGHVVAKAELMGKYER